MHCFASLLLMAVTLPIALGCSCSEPPPLEESIANTPYIFVGTVKHITARESNELISSTSVEDALKGDVADMVSVATAFTSAGCKYNFIQGQKYIVFAYATQEGGFATNSCMATSGYSENVHLIIQLILAGD